MTLFIGILLFFLLIYLATIFLFILGWIKTKEFSPAANNNPLSYISIIVAFRNEEKNIENLISSISSLKYDAEYFETILVNDHSEDSSPELVRKSIKSLKNFHLLNLGEEEFGKKAAIRSGIRQAKGELVAITDADCTIPSEWLNTADSFYQENNQPDMICGLVTPQTSGGILQKAFKLDFLSLLVSSVGAAYWNRPVFNNAANLFVKKDNLIEIDLHNEIASGDDVFLLHKLKKENTNIKVIKSRNNLVSTSLPENLTEFLSQRIRWASKASSYYDKDSVFISWLIFLVNFLLLTAYITLPVSGNLHYLIVAFGSKLLIDFLMFISCSHFFKISTFELLLVPLIELFYPAYIVFAAIMSKIKPSQWKGRNIR